MKQYDYLICGSAGVNKFFMVDELPDKGKTVYFENNDFEKLYFGGPGLNIAFQLSKLGVNVVPMLCQTAGQMYQAELEKLLTENGAPLDAMTPPDSYEPHYAVLIQDRCHQHMTICQSFAGASTAEQRMDEKWFAEIKQAVICANAPQNVARFLKNAEKYDNDVIFSVKKDNIMFPDDFVRRILNLTTILFMNEEEAAHILSVTGTSDIRELFKNRKLSEVIITAGGSGSTLYTRDGREEHIDVTPAKMCVDATGVGDGYVSGYLYGKARGMKPADCARIASTLASFIIEAVGDISNVPDAHALLKRNSEREDQK